jgi:hypothetical protein
MEFFENEFNVQFVDSKPGKRALDIVVENEKKMNSPYNNPTYKSDYDKFLDLGGDDND